MPLLESPTAPREEGLRERKKRETARAIERAAVELAAELGLSEVTVDAISERADVTSRTFFNYYASKEDAVLGNSRAFPPPTLGDLEWRAGTSVLDTVIEAVAAEFAGIDFGTPEFQAQRRALVVANPHLLVSDFQNLGVIEENFAAQIERVLGEEGVVPAAERAERAWAIVFYVGGVLRLALHTWSLETRSRRPLADHVAEARDTLHAVSRAG